jgi:hypothetical protein
LSSPAAVLANSPLAPAPCRRRLSNQVATVGVLTRARRKDARRGGHRRCR